jgi:hypothetical protein
MEYMFGNLLNKIIQDENLCIKNENFLFLIIPFNCLHSNSIEEERKEGGKNK